MTAFDGGRENWEADLARRKAEVCGDALGIDGAQLVAARVPAWRSLWLPLLPIALALGLVCGVAVAAWGADDVATICAPGYAKAQRLAPEQYYPIAKAAFARAGVPWADRHSYQLDHVIPLCAGGDWSPGNLQVQPLAAAHEKDKLERRACRAVCAGTISIDEARRWFTREAR